MLTSSPTPTALLPPTLLPTLEPLPVSPFGRAELSQFGGTLTLVPGIPSSSRGTISLRARVATNASRGFALTLLQGPVEVAGPGSPRKHPPSAPRLSIAAVSDHGAMAPAGAPAPRVQHLEPRGTVIADAEAPPPPGQTQEVDIQVAVEADFNVPPGVYTQELQVVFEPRFSPRTPIPGLRPPLTTAIPVAKASPATDSAQSQ